MATDWVFDEGSQQWVPVEVADNITAPLPQDTLVSPSTDIQQTKNDIVPPIDNSEKPNEAAPAGADVNKDVIPPPPQALTPIAQMDYEAQYAKEHGIVPPTYPEDKLKEYQQARGYTAPGSGVLMPFVPGYDTAPENQKIPGIATKDEWLNIGAPTGKDIKLPEVVTPKDETKTLTIGVQTDKPEDILFTDNISQLQKDSPGLYKVLVNEGYDNYEKAVNALNFEYQQGVARFDKSNTLLPDGNYIANSELEKVKSESPEAYKILLKSGFDDANIYISNENARIAFENADISLLNSREQRKYDSLVEKAKPFTNPDGKIRVYDALVSGVMSQKDILDLTGSEVDTKIPVPFTVFGDSYIKSHPILGSNGKPILDGKGNPIQPSGPGLEGIGQFNYPHWYQQAQAAYNRIYGPGASGKAVARMDVGESAGALVGPVPAKLLEPSMGIHSTNAGDWIQLGVGIATLAAPLYLPKIAELAPKMNPLGKVTMPLANGEDVTVWKGVKLGSNPLIGVSKGDLVVGAKNIRLPMASELKLPGAEGAPFEPRSGLESKVFGTKSAMVKMGFPEEAITTVERTLPEVQSFAGKPSPYLNKQLVVEGTDTLSPKGVEAVLRQGVTDSRMVDSVKNYGSYSMRPQLSPEAYDEWVNKFGRAPGDIDVQLGNVGKDGAAAFTKRLVDNINKAGGDKVWLDPENPTLVMAKSRTTGANRHAIDVHYEGEPSNTPSSKQFQDMVYGFKKESPLVEVDLPGVGKVKLAGLAETGIGKTEQVLGWRVNTDTGVVRVGTEAHRVKDYVDLYEIIKTYGKPGQAEAWAKDIGLDLEGLSKIKPNGVKDLGWEFSPSKGGKVSSIRTSNPSVTVIGSSLRSAASSVPIGVTKSGNLVVLTSVGKPSMGSKSGGKSNALNNSSRSSLAIQSTQAVREILSPRSYAQSIGSSVKPTPSPKNKITKSLETPSKSLATLKPISPPAGVVPSTPDLRSPGGKNPISPNPQKINPPSPKIPLVPELPYPPPENGKKPIPPLIIGSLDKKELSTIIKKKSPIAWKQGFVWWTISYPYTSKSDISVGKKAPQGAYMASGIGSAYKTIQALGGNAQLFKSLDMGIMDIGVKAGEGEKPALRFKLDSKQRTHGEISLKGIRG